MSSALRSILEPVNFPSNEARGVQAVIATELAGGDALGAVC